MLKGRDLHLHILSRVEEELGSRSWNWLAEQAGVPQSTLATQVGKPKFSVDVLVKIAQALEVDLGHFFPTRGDLVQGSLDDADDSEQSA